MVAKYLYQKQISWLLSCMTCAQVSTGDQVSGAHNCHGGSTLLSFHTGTQPHGTFSTTVTGWCCCNGIVHHKIVNLLPVPQVTRGGGQSCLSGMQKDYLLKQQLPHMTFSLHPHVHPLTQCCMIACPPAASEVDDSEGFLCNACFSVQMAPSLLCMTLSSRFSQRNLRSTGRAQAVELQVCRGHFLMQAGSFIQKRDNYLAMCVTDGTISS